MKKFRLKMTSEKSKSALKQSKQQRAHFFRHFLQNSEQQNLYFIPRKSLRLRVHSILSLSIIKASLINHP